MGRNLFRMVILSFNMRSEMLKLRPFEILATYDGAIKSSGMKLSGELTAFNAPLVSIRHAHMTLLFVCNHVKLEVPLFVINFNSRGFSLRVLYCVVDAGYGLGRSLGDCGPALPKGQKHQMVKTKTEPQYEAIV